MIIDTTELKLLDQNENIVELPSLANSLYFPASVADQARPALTIRNQTDIIRVTELNGFIAVKDGVVNSNSYFQTTPTRITLKNGYYIELQSKIFDFSPNITYYLYDLYDNSGNLIGDGETFVQNNSIGTTEGNFRDAGVIALYDETNDRYLIGAFSTRLSNGYTYVEFYLASSGNYGLNSTTVFIEGALPSSDIIGTGGGATHIAKVTGVLSALSSNLSDILLVAGGGGGGLIREGTAYVGSDAGGISGNGRCSGNQSSGYAFGQGDEGCGGGLYGGNKPTFS